MVALVLNIKDHSVMRGRKKVPVYIFFMTPLLKFVCLWQSVRVFAYPFVLFHLTDGYQITSEEQASLQMRLQNSLKIQVGKYTKSLHCDCLQNSLKIQVGKCTKSLHCDCLQNSLKIQVGKCTKSLHCDCL